jgi:hypothetical protein
MDGVVNIKTGVVQQASNINNSHIDEAAVRSLKFSYVASINNTVHRLKNE